MNAVAGDPLASIAPRVAEHLNRALHRLFAREERLYLLGEDLVDPYGGAFKITKGLSTGYPDRVLSTPLSEGGIVGAGGGLALCGNKVIVEIMFGDFIALAFDQLLNFASKSVSMYGHEVPVPLVVRCPVGGSRGYGPTHSQSPQKHFIGIPNLVLYELSPFHDAEAVLDTALTRGVPGIFFEDKVLYTRRMYRDGRVDDQFRYEMLGSATGWAHAFPEEEGGAVPDAVVLAPGGMTHRALDAARRLRAEHGRSVHLLTPAQLHPLDLAPVLPLLASAGRIVVVEESTAGGTWGAEVARLLHERIWSSLRGPVLLLNSADSIIPTAAHLESQVLLGADRITAAIAAAAGWGRATGAGVPAGEAAGNAEREPGVPLVVPKLNNNDTTYLVTDWLVDEGEWVEPGTDVVSLETSKAVQDIEATGAGHIHRVVTVGQETEVGAVLAVLLPQPLPLGGQVPAAPASAAPASTASASAAPVPEPRTEPPAPAPVPPVPGSRAPARVQMLDRIQLGTAAVVTRSHREIPTGFTVVRADVGATLDALAELGEETGTTFGLAEAVIKAVAAQFEEFPLFFGSLSDDRTVGLADAPHVGVTVDTDGSLYVPVIRHAHEQSLEDVADTLMEFRMKALTKDFLAQELDGGNIAVSLNPDPGVVLAHPIVLWPQLCMVSVGAVDEEYRPGADGTPRTVRYVHLGLAYDHRVVNGRDAVRFLNGVRAVLERRGEARRWLGDAALTTEGPA
ncbi:2-oxo acid dehydrogenase subunit E2 [Streptomyces sp. NPDC091416]|uniref:2-oxo acid dehydrogenase subunit E2 n=1 Tax=Streptomyces sp. NPDC091416 TaxID=3366003 RepID=UPI00381350B6